MTIKYLVLSGGGYTGLITYGVLKKLSAEGYWNVKDTVAIYGTSIGAIVGVMLMLGYEWDFLDNYIINRPWNKLMEISPDNFIDLNIKKGLFDSKIISEVLLPLLEAKGFSKTITLKDFYEKTQVSLNTVACNLNVTNEIVTETISYITHPDMPLLKAVEASACIPFLFSPICYNGACYVDGGMLVNYPLNICLDETKCEEDEVFAIKNKWKNNNYKINKDTSLIDFIFIYLKKSHNFMENTMEQKTIKNCITCLIDGSSKSPHTYTKLIYKQSTRKSLIKEGEKYAEEFLQRDRGSP